MTVPLFGRLGLPPSTVPSIAQQTRNASVGLGRHRAPGPLEKLQNLAVNLRAKGRSPTPVSREVMQPGLDASRSPGRRNVIDFSQFHEIYGIGYIGGDIVPGPRGLVETF